MSLTERLQRYRKALLERAKDPKKVDPALAEGWSELHQAALKDPAAYVAFLRAPGNEDLCEGLLQVLSPFPNIGHLILVQEPPAVILDALADLMRAGSKVQQLAAGRLARDLLQGAAGKSDVLLEPCLSLLSSDDPRAQATALAVLQTRRPERLEESLDLVGSLWKKSDDAEVRQACLSALSAMKSAAADQLFFERISETLREHATRGSDPLGQPALEILRGRLLAVTGGNADRYGDVLLTALRSATDAGAYQSCALAALDLPIAKASSVLEQASASAPTPAARAVVQAVLDQIRAGEVRPERLRLILQRSIFGR
jgi:hypothetical protein